MPAKASPVLQITNLSADIGGRDVLRDISVTVAPNQWVAVVGSSGAGKSTLLRVIMGLRRPACPTSGTLIFQGVTHDLRHKSWNRPKGIALVPQSPAHGLDPLRRLGWQWARLAKLKLGDGSFTAAYQQLFEALGLPRPADQWPHQWSRGMQQRLLLAMALMERPKLLVLDEPTSALDPLIAAQVLAEVQRLTRDRGIGVMMVTHDLALAAQFSDQLAIMASGRIVETGATEPLLRAPQHPEAQMLVSHRHWTRADSVFTAAE